MEWKALTVSVELTPLSQPVWVMQDGVETTTPTSCPEGGSRLHRNEVFAQLVERCWKRAYWIAFDILGDASEAEDLCQDALLRAYEKWGSFREESSVDAWFYRIITNLCLNRKRRRGIWGRVRQWLVSEQVQDIQPFAAQSLESPEKQLQSKEIADAVHLAMEHLSTQQRAVFVLRYLQDFSIKEISEITELSEGTIKTHIFRALRTMRTHLKDAR